MFELSEAVPIKQRYLSVFIITTRRFKSDDFWRNRTLCYGFARGVASRENE